MCACTCVCVHVCVCARCESVCVCVCVLCLSVSVNLSLFVCLSVCLSVCQSVCLSVCCVCVCGKMASFLAAATTSPPHKSTRSPLRGDRTSPPDEKPFPNSNEQAPKQGQKVTRSTSSHSPLIPFAISQSPCLSPKV